MIKNNTLERNQLPTYFFPGKNIPACKPKFQVAPSTGPKWGCGGKGIKVAPCRQGNDSDKRKGHGCPNTLSFEWRGHPIIKSRRPVPISNPKTSGTPNQAYESGKRINHSIRNRGKFVAINAGKSERFWARKGASIPVEGIVDRLVSSIVFKSISLLLLNALF